MNNLQKPCRPWLGTCCFEGSEVLTVEAATFEGVKPVVRQEAVEGCLDHRDLVVLRLACWAPTFPNGNKRDHPTCCSTTS
jgi:hypothetical protein